MKVSLVTLSNNLYNESRERLVKSAHDYGITDVKAFDFAEIKNTNFYDENKNILSNEKFMGYWLWKPYIILDTLNLLNENDILLYVDAGAEIIHSMQSIISICEKETDIVVFGNANDTNCAWTKRDCFVLMDCDSERFWYSSHCDASIMLFKKTNRSIDFLNQWLSFGCNANILTNSINICGLPNRPEYIEHRYDQSILSLLAEKFELPIYRVPSQFGNHYKMHRYRIVEEFNCINQSQQQQLPYYYFISYYNSPYGQLINHHRTKNVLVKAEIQNNIVEDSVAIEQSNSDFIRNSVKNILSVFSKK